MFDNIQIFDFQGKFLYYWGSPGNKEEEFWMPSGIMIDRDETIWVTDTYNSRIQIFKISEAGQ
jgi:sugar lactone lactonase YvrE